MAIALYLLNTNFLKNEEIFQQKMRGLTEVQQENILKKKNREDRIRSLGAKLLLEKILNDREIEQQELKYSQYGKPYLKYENNLYFNISHSGEYVACTVGDTEMGVDIQLKKEVSFKVAKKCFTKREYEQLQNLNQQDNINDMFFQYWSAKESFVKCTGHGLQKSLNQLEVDTVHMTICDLESNETYHLKEYHCLENYSLFACCKSNEFGLFVKTIYYKL